MALPDLIIPVDPGATSGYLAWSRGEIVTKGELAPNDLLNWAEQRLYTWRGRPTLIVVERWRVTNKTARLSEQLDAPYVTGALRWLAHKYDAEFVLQEIVKDGKGSPCPDRVLKALGWYQRTPGGHQNDAHRQLYLALLKRGWQPPPEALAKIFSE